MLIIIGGTGTIPHEENTNIILLNINNGSVETMGWEYGCNMGLPTLARAMCSIIYIQVQSNFIEI